MNENRDLLKANALDVIRGNHPGLRAISVEQALFEIGGAIEALPYHWLYWPDLVEVAGAIFVDLYGVGASEIERRLEAATTGGDRGRSSSQWGDLVDSFNFFELAHLFKNWGGSLGASEGVLKLLGELIVEPWQTRLRSAYLDRSFIVQLTEPTNGLDLRVAVRQISPELRPHPLW